MLKKILISVLMLLAWPVSSPQTKQIPLNIVLKFSDASPVSGTLTLSSLNSTGTFNPLANWSVPIGGKVNAWVPDDTSLTVYQISYVGTPHNGSLIFIPGVAPYILSTVHYFTLQITLDRSTGNVTTPGMFSWN